MYARCRLLREVDSWPLLRATLGCRFQRGGESHKTGQLENIQVRRVKTYELEFLIFSTWNINWVWSLIIWYERGSWPLTFVVMWHYVPAGPVLTGIYVTPNMVTHAQRILQEMTAGYSSKPTWSEPTSSDRCSMDIFGEVPRKCVHTMCFKKMWTAHRPHMIHSRGHVPTGQSYGVHRFQIQYLRWGPSEQS